MLRNSRENWGNIARALHWIMAILILAQLVLGKVAEEMGVSPLKLDLFVWHKSIGISVLLLVVLRLVWRLGNPPPAELPGIAPWESRLAKLGHAALYLLMFAVPLSGWWISDTSRIPFRWFWTVPLPDILAADKDMNEIAEEVHEFLTQALMVVVAVHVLAALRHHFLLRNATLERMLGLNRKARD